MMLPTWYEKDGVKKLFNELPTEAGWEPCSGHYDFALGIWIDEEAEVAEPKASKPVRRKRKAKGAG